MPSTPEAALGDSRQTGGTIAPQEFEKRHYHVYFGYRDPYRGVRMFGTHRDARFESRTRAHAYAEAEQPDRRFRLVMRCDFGPRDCPSREPIHISERRDDR